MLSMAVLERNFDNLLEKYTFNFHFIIIFVTSIDYFSSAYHHLYFVICVFYSFLYCVSTFLTNFEELFISSS